MSNPCHHGDCSNAENDYLCTCMKGFEGKDCDVPESEFMMLLSILFVTSSFVIQFVAMNLMFYLFWILHPVFVLETLKKLRILSNL